MIKEVTIKLGATTPTDKQYESARADIELTYTVPDEAALNLDSVMQLYNYELNRARIHLKGALLAVKDELRGKLPEGMGKSLKATEAEQLRKLLKDYEGGD